ncbi:hypothetical protein KWV16_11785 [Clostridioides difficile]|nr:hypothetical protein [Clostridioides difficile]
MANLLEYVTLFQQELDMQTVAGSTTGWMEKNAGQVIYDGGREVKVPKVSMDGLGDYDRSKGYAPGAVTLEYETMRMEMDRGREFMLDSMDVNETNFIVNASSVMGLFQKKHVIPEIDAYRYSKIFSEIAKIDECVKYSYEAAAATILSELKYQIASIQDSVGEIPLVISMSSMIASILEQSTQLDDIEFGDGDIKRVVKSIDDVPIIKVPSKRMKTEYIFMDGKTSGQTGGGFKEGPKALDINWLITPSSAPIAVSKTDKPRIFTPDQNQTADAYKIDYRKYHDLWLLEEQLKLCRASVKQAKAVQE